MFPFDKGAAPDLPDQGHSFLVTARNAYAGVLGYEPVRGLSQMTAALPETWTGGGSFKAPDGTVTLLAATNGGLYTLTASAATKVSAGTYSANWFFYQFGNLVVCINGAAPLKYTLSTGVAAALGGSPPTCSFGAVVRDFVFLAGNSTNQNRVYWSGLNDAEGWTVGTNQCDVQDIPDGGAITGLAGGEFGLAFLDDAIHIFEYVGTPAIFTRRKVSSGIGALCHGGIAQHGVQTFFYSRRGFYKFVPGSDPVAIGRNKVDRTFRTTYSVSEITNSLRCTIDPERSLVIWSMPDRMWVYNFENDMWSDIAITGIVGISTGRTASLTLEQIAVTFPSIETVDPPLDDPFWSGGDPMLLIAYSDNKLYSFGSSSNLEARFRLPQLEPNPGRVSHVRSTRVVGTGITAQVSIDCRARMGDSPINVTSSDVRTNGEIPIRASGRYLQPVVIYPAGSVWTSIQGFDIEATAGGRG